MPVCRFLLGVLVLVAVGCVPGGEPATTADTAPPVNTDAPIPPDPPYAPAAAEQAAIEPSSDPAAEASPPAAAPEGTPPADPPAERVEAAAGVGKQGQSLKNESGVLVEAAKAYFNVRQRAVFEIQIPKAVELFEATEGRKPNSHEEFMEKIIRANSITLPNLPANNRYVYDVERGELMVEKPAR